MTHTYKGREGLRQREQPEQRPGKFEDRQGGQCSWREEGGAEGSCKGRWGVLRAALNAGSSRGSGPELSLPLQASRCRSRRNALSPLPSASDSTWTGGLGVRSFQHRSPDGGLRQPENSGIQAAWSQSLDKEAWAPSSSEAHPWAPRRSRDKPVDRGDGWGTGSALRPSLRRPRLGDPPAEGAGQKWAREPAAWSGRRAKDHSLGRVTWAPL